MTERQAERIANAVLGVAVAGISFYVLKTPALRRVAWQLTRAAVGAAGPWLASELRSAWSESGRDAHSPPPARPGDRAGL